MKNLLPLAVSFERERVVDVLAYDKKLLMSPADFARSDVARAIELLVLFQQQFVLARCFVVRYQCTLVWFVFCLGIKPAYSIVFVQMNIHDVALKDADVHAVNVAGKLTY